jgi:hypothetical protein
MSCVDYIVYLILYFNINITEMHNLKIAINVHLQLSLTVQHPEFRCYGGCKLHYMPK